MVGDMAGFSSDSLLQTGQYPKYRISRSDDWKVSFRGFRDKGFLGFIPLAFRV